VVVDGFAGDVGSVLAVSLSSDSVVINTCAGKRETLHKVNTHREWVAVVDLVGPVDLVDHSGRCGHMGG
jgi:hypothetical protein